MKWKKNWTRCIQNHQNLATPLFTTVVLCTKYDQALNNLTATDENKLRIVEAGALPHYVKLLSQGREKSEQQAAAYGIWMLAFMHKGRIVREPGCLAGC